MDTCSGGSKNNYLHSVQRFLKCYEHFYDLTVYYDTATWSWNTSAQYEIVRDTLANTTILVDSKKTEEERQGPNKSAYMTDEQFAYLNAFTFRRALSFKETNYAQYLSVMQHWCMQIILVFACTRVADELEKLLKEQFGIAPSSDENEVAQQTIEATSTFESQPLTRLRWSELDHEVIRQLIAAAEGRDAGKISAADLLAGAAVRGLVWHDPQAGEHYATAAGIVLLAKDPSAVFPQCRILADAYRGAEPDGNPHDHEDIRRPMPTAIDRAIAFIDRNTRHPMRVVGLNRIRLDEYPVEALREALVNAVAHRQYEDAGRKIMLEVFADRVVISSPSLPPSPITLAREYVDNAN